MNKNYTLKQMIVAWENSEVWNWKDAKIHCRYRNRTLDGIQDEFCFRCFYCCCDDLPGDMYSKYVYRFECMGDHCTLVSEHITPWTF